MADSCQQATLFLPTAVSVVGFIYDSKALSETEPVLRRLITLISAGWLPPDLASRGAASASTPREFDRWSYHLGLSRVLQTVVAPLRLPLNVWLNCPSIAPA